MPVMDEFKEEREALKHGTPKEKLSYFVYYYKWHVIITVFAIIAVASFIHEALTRKESAFFACMLNTVVLTSAEEYSGEFAEYAQIDTEEYDVTFDTSLYINPTGMDESTVAGSQKFIAYLAAAEMDVMVTDAGSITTYANQEDFMPLDRLLSPEQYEMYSPYFYYIDMKAVEKWRAYMDDPENLLLDISYDFPDPRHPENMEEPVAVGIYLDSCSSLRETFHFQGSDVVFAVFENTTRPETALKYLEFLFR